jgi:hypothetical protein
VDAASPKVNPPLTPPAAPDLKTISRESERHIACIGSIVCLGVVLFFGYLTGPLMAVAILIYGGIAFGIWKNSRIVSLIGLLVGIANVVFFVIALTHLTPEAAGKFAPGLILVCIWVKFLFQSVLGTFAYHRHLAAAHP